jgi:hypothetical protein
MALKEPQGGKQLALQQALGQRAAVDRRMAERRRRGMARRRSCRCRTRRDQYGGIAAGDLRHALEDRHIARAWLMNRNFDGCLSAGGPVARDDELEPWMSKGLERY